MLPSRTGMTWNSLLQAVSCGHHLAARPRTPGYELAGGGARRPRHGRQLGLQAASPNRAVQLGTKPDRKTAFSWLKVNGWCRRRTGGSATVEVRVSA
jgi:hypothetical protein